MLNCNLLYVELYDTEKLSVQIKGGQGISPFPAELFRPL